MVLAWQVHRLPSEPERIPLLAAAYSLATGFWWLIFPIPVLLCIPVFALTVALSEFLFPISYRLTNRGVHADCGLSRNFIAWNEIRRVTRGKDGVYLSPFPRPSRRDEYRGVRLRYAGNQDAVHAAIRSYRATPRQEEP